MKRELKSVGKTSYAAIVEMVDGLNQHSATGDYQTGSDNENARETILQDALSCEVRSGWQSLGEPLEASEYCLLLGTGGPAVRIVGELDRGEPSSARLEVQDWGTPWTEYRDADESVLLQYAGCFYFGE